MYWKAITYKGSSWDYTFFTMIIQVLFSILMTYRLYFEKFFEFGSLFVIIVLEIISKSLILFMNVSKLIMISFVRSGHGHLVWVRGVHFVTVNFFCFGFATKWNFFLVFYDFSWLRIWINNRKSCLVTSNEALANRGFQLTDRNHVCGSLHNKESKQPDIYYYIDCSQTSISFLNEYILFIMHLSPVSIELTYMF